MLGRFTEKLAKVLRVHTQKGLLHSTFFSRLNTGGMNKQGSLCFKQEDCGKQTVRRAGWSLNAKSDQNLRHHQTLGFYLKKGHVWPQKEETPFHSTFVKILSVLMFISKKII